MARASTLSRNGAIRKGRYESDRCTTTLYKAALRVVAAVTLVVFALVIVLVVLPASRRAFAAT